MGNPRDMYYKVFFPGVNKILKIQKLKGKTPLTKPNLM